MGAGAAMTQTDVTLVLITCANASEARAIGRALVEARLAACVHLRPHTAIYRWAGAIEEAEEITLLVKTTTANTQAIEAAVLARHSYALPAILTVPVSGGYGPFLEWVGAESGPAA